MRTAFVLAAVIAAFAWGMAAGAYQVFPYELVRGGKNLVDGDDGSRDPNAYVGNPLAVEVGRSDPQWGTKADIVMIGDSITAQARLEEMFPSASIANRGVGGDTVQGALDRLPGILEANPSRAFVLLGINDVFFDNPTDAIVSRYGQLLEQLKKAGVEATIQSVIVCGDAPICTAQRRQKAKELNKKLRSLASDRGISFLDLNARLSDENGLQPQYTWDGVHLNAEGNRVWRDVLTAYMLDPNSMNGAP